MSGRTMPEAASSSVDTRRFGDLRGVQWRIDLGILPASPSASVDDLRRVTANSRRSYAALRKQLLVDPHLLKDGSNLPDLVMDNPLSQNPDSMWSRFFRNAELERMVDQDLTRLYPERGGYFQTSGCQVMLRRILLLWCLKHPKYGYRQGMHELLAPLLYVLHVDYEHLSEVRKAYEDHFADKFDGLSYHENDLSCKFDFKKFPEHVGDTNKVENNSTKATAPADLDPATRTIVLLSDAYGAEGELGVVLSEKFMEHDAYSMFDTLMSGAGGVVAMAEFFCPTPYGSSHTGFSPVIEASVSIYNLLATVDSSLHTHLVELGVEPQYFSLRWLRVLFGREFSLEDLLLIWDEIFACDNAKYIRATDDSDAESGFGVLDSLRGAFVSAFSVSMMLQLRSSLLASDNATACLQKLLNFPEDADLEKMVAKAKSLQALAVDVNRSSSLLHHGWHDERKLVFSRSRSRSGDPSSPRTPLNVVPESYWEEKWRVLNEEEENKQGSIEKHVFRVIKGWSERVKLLRLSRRTMSDSSSLEKTGKDENPKMSVRRNLSGDLLECLGLDESESTRRNDANCDENMEKKCSNPPSRVGSEENFRSFLGPPSLTRTNGDRDREIESESSSVASNWYDVEPCETQPGCSSPLPVSNIPDGDDCSKCDLNDDAMGKPESTAVTKERGRSLSDKLQRLWKFGKNTGEGVSDRLIAATKEAQACNKETDRNNACSVSTASKGSSQTSKGETIDENFVISLRNLGRSMLENIQVIESVIQQQEDWGEMRSPGNSKNGLLGKGEDTAVSALKELRKISNILTEM